MISNEALLFGNSTTASWMTLCLFSVYAKTFQSGSMKLTSQEIDQKLEIDFFSKS